MINNHYGRLTEDYSQINGLYATEIKKILI